MRRLWRRCRAWSSVGLLASLRKMDVRDEHFDLLRLRFLFVLHRMGH
jgi:hypothetical protein